MGKGKADERLETMKKKQKNFFITIGIILAISISIIVLYKVQSTMSNDQNIEYEDSIASGNYVSIDSSKLSDGNFHYYSHTIDGVRIKYFIVQDDNGEIHSAFDACEVCFGEKKGYTQDGDHARCENCGRTFSIYGLGTKNANGGGCWPGFLPHTLEGSKLKINTGYLESGSYLFS
jgi:uncharacterized membrane protein